MHRKKICPNCLTGAKTYALDKRSPVCPYLHFNNGKKCPFYKPLPNNDKGDILSKILNRL